MMRDMPRYLDLDTWPRRAAFDYFSRFDKPYFNVCTRIDVAALKAAAAASGGGISLACAYLALRLANASEPFRLRLEGGRVRVHDALRGSTTVLRDDESIAFAYLDLGTQALGVDVDAPRVARRAALEHHVFDDMADAVLGPALVRAAGAHIDADSGGLTLRRAQRQRTHAVGQRVDEDIVVRAAHGWASQSAGAAAAASKASM